MSARPRQSLVRQTVGLALTAQIVCASLLCGAALLHERSTQMRAFDMRLQGRSDSLLGAIQDAEDPDDNVAIDPAELEVPGQDVYAVYNQGGRLLGSSADAPAALTAREGDGFREVQVGHRRYRLLQREGLRVIDRAESDGVGLRRPVTILYASPEGHVWHETLEAVRFYLLAIAFAAAVTAVLVSLLLQRALQPLSELAAAAEQLAAPALRFVPPPSALQVRELRPLADVLTAAVARLRESFASEHRFVGDAAHELKTAIAVVRSSVQLLMMRRRTGDEYAAGLDRILEDTQRTEALVAQMLELARWEESTPAEAAEVDLAAVAAEVAERLQPIAMSRGVKVCVELHAGTRARLPAGSVETLLSNLLHNALQHSPAGASVWLRVRCDAAAVTLEVVDEGEGIGAAALPHIFERFYREDRSRSRETGGTGLGLAICKSIVEAAGATIAVESKPGSGTLVRVTFIPA